MAPLLTILLPVALQAAPPPAGAYAPPASPTAPNAESAPATMGARTVRLQEAEQAALAHQPTMLQARASREAAEGRSEQARSGLLPQITGTATYQHGAGPARVGTTTIPGTGTSGGATYDFFSFGGTATQLIWDFGQTYERSRAAGRLVDASRATERASELQVLVNVRRAFFQARAQKALLRVARETVENQEKHLAQIQGFVDVGTRPEIDVAQARSDVANAEVQRINAENGYAIAKAQLNQAMGTPGTLDFDVSDDGFGAIPGEGETTEQLVTRALANRPELVSLERQKEAQKATVRSFKGGYGPSLSAQAGASESGGSLGNLSAGWNIGATLTWPIFQGGLTNGQVHEAEGNFDVANAELEAERLQVRVEVEQANLSIQAAKASIRATNDALTNARERLRLAEGRYTSGVGSVIELSDAQVAATSAAAQVVQAEYNLAAARAQLLAALGQR